jgi:flagellar basal-body rod protein FlgF/flagellar basal-body rod protein FlgG
MNAMRGISRAQEVIANNLANIDTTGFRKDRLFFHALDQKMGGKELRSVQPKQIVQLDEGTYTESGNTWDFAINGKAFFQIEHNGQYLLTRNGQFQLDADGYLIDGNGGFVQGNAGRIHLPELLQIEGDYEEVIIDVAKDGTIHMNDQVLDKVALVGVADPNGLERRGNSYFAAMGTGGVFRDNESVLNQGFVETGNVNTLEEMTNMMANLQLFESQQKAMKTTDEILQQVTTRLGRFGNG